jgi:hypothetical protein
MVELRKLMTSSVKKQELALKMLNHREEGQTLSDKDQSSAYLLVEMVTIAFATKLITKNPHD